MLPCFTKTFESVINNSIVIYLILKYAPHNRFVPNRSTTSNILELCDYVYNALIEWSQIDAIYTNFHLKKLTIIYYYERLIKYLLTMIYLEGLNLTWITEYS